RRVVWHIGALFQPRDCQLSQIGLFCKRARRHPPTHTRKAEPPWIEHFLYSGLTSNLRIEVDNGIGCVLLDSGSVVVASVSEINALNCGDELSALDDRPR